MQDTTERKDVYSRITAQIVEHLEKGVRPWIRPWNAEHAAGRITRPLRHNGQPYSGINILSLWMSALGQSFTAPIWMTFRQASELNAHVSKGEKGSLVVYANAITRTERDEKTGEDVEREIPYMKGYTVFNVEQIEGLPEIYYAKATPSRDPVARIEHAEKFFASLGATIKHGGNRAYYAQELTTYRCRPLKPSAMLRATTPLLLTKSHIGRSTRSALTATLAARAGATKVTAARNLLPSLALLSCAPISNCIRNRGKRTPPISRLWLEVLKNDNRAIFAAAAHAQRAADYLNQKAAAQVPETCAA